MLKKILLLVSVSLVIITSVTGCAFRRTTYIPSTDRLYIIPAGTEFVSVDNGKRSKVVAPVDLVAEGKGNYFEKLKKLNRGE